MFILTWLLAARPVPAKGTLLSAGVSSEVRGTGAGPLSWVTGSSILTLALPGTVLPKGAVGASWDGRRGDFAKSSPAPPGLGPTGLQMYLSHPKLPVSSCTFPGDEVTWQALRPRPPGAFSLGGQMARSQEAHHSTSEAMRQRM